MATADDICGGSYRMNLYQASSSTTTTSTSTSTSASPTSTGWSSYGCVAEGTTGSRRALTGASFNQANMTPQNCQNLCSGFKYAGVEYRQARFVIFGGTSISDLTLFFHHYYKLVRNVGVNISIFENHVLTPFSQVTVATR